MSYTCRTEKINKILLVTCIITSTRVTVGEAYLRVILLWSDSETIFLQRNAATLAQPLGPNFDLVGF